ncbi:unnamed protein product [Ilex paraguariensis]|uniref:Helicase C-terminal domain-containing protein n=1 Tax=Ilex paraguariensis TaxID=185542 RepID=A0ABC8RSQ5_9AQUA
MLWPGLLGNSKYEFAKTYCSVKFIRGCQSKVFQDFSKGMRLDELNVLLKQTVMIRRLKEHVLVQLPPIRRQIISLALKRSDIVAAMASVVRGVKGDASADNDATDNAGCSKTSRKLSDQEVGIAKVSGFREWLSIHPIIAELDGQENTETSLSSQKMIIFAHHHKVLDRVQGRNSYIEIQYNAGCSKTSRKLSDQEVGIAKVSGFREWLSIHPIIAELDGQENTETSLSSQKMIIFAHHHKVLDRVQEFICEKGVGFVRIDGNTPAGDRQLAVQSFQSSEEVKIAIIGILAGGSGLNLSSAQNVVFLELPKEPAHMLQAEGRAHRRGQTKAVNIYIFCAKGTSDESLWQQLNKSLYRVSSTMNGKYDAVQEIAVDSVSYLETTGETDGRSENSFLERASAEVSAVELIKLPSVCFDQNLQPVEACDVLDENANKRYAELNENICKSSQKDNLHTEADFASNLEMGSTVPNAGPESNASESKAESAGGVSSHYSDGSENKYRMKKVNKTSPETKDLNHDLSVELCEAAANSSMQVNSLRFEVSQYTGRIHLYSCIPQVDSRPRPLFENFRSEEVESQLPPVEDRKTTAYNCIKEDPRYRHALVAFVDEWNKLRPIERKKLLSKPLQLPLSIELCYLKESNNHDCEGLLKGGSKRRTTPWDEITNPLPPNAIWRMVCLCGGYGKKEKKYAQGWTLLDEPLCKLCQTPCKGGNAKAPEFFEDLFCNLGCYEEYRLRTSNRSLREGLFQIERGICMNCQLDCHKLVERIRPLSYAKRQEYIKKVAPKLAQRKKLLDKLVHDPTEGNAWHADHIVPVYRGGGECKLENMRTFCVACHADVTVAQCAERRSRRVKAKKQLKVIMSDLRNIKSTAQIDAELKDRDQLEINEKKEEDELLIKVPGSAYSRAETISTSPDQENPLVGNPES